MQQEIGSVVGTMVKCCFATRVYQFSERNTFITAFIVLLALGQLGVAIVFRTRLPALVDPPSLNLKMLATISLTLGVLTDVVTAASLCFFLWRMRTGQSSAANSLINRLVTEILTTVVSLSTLLLFDFLDGNLIFAATYFLLPKLYAVSFLATLNTLHVIRGRGTDHEQASATRRRTGATGGSRRPKGGGDAKVETKMFHLRTRMPSMYAGDDEAYPAQYPEYDLKRGFPPEPTRGFEPAYAL